MFAETQETLTRAQQSQMECTMSVYNSMANFFERWQKVQFDLCRSWLQGSRTRVERAASVKEMSDVSGLQGEAFQSAVAHFVSAAQEGHYLNQQIRSELTDAARKQIDQVNMTLTQALESARQMAPSGSADAFVAVCKQVMSMGNNFYEAMFRLAKQVADMSDASFQNTAQASSCVAHITGADCCVDHQHEVAPQAAPAHPASTGKKK